jgi:hypothetical protein
MSSGDILHTDWYTDPPWDDVSLSWILNYVNNIRTNPVLAQAVANERDQFEMVPMPKEVLDHLATSRRVSTVVGPSSVANVTLVNEVLTKFTQALETGRLEDAAGMLSPDYHDASGRNANQVMGDLRRLLGGVSGLKIVPFSTDDLLVIGSRLLANIQVAWTADVKEGAGSSRKTAAAHVELVLEKNKHGAWSISSVRAS